MSVSLTQDEAIRRIQDIHDARDRAVTKLNQISDTQQSMLTSGWHGSSAGTYGRVAQEQREEFDRLIATLNHVVDSGSTHMRDIANLDNG